MAGLFLGTRRRTAEPVPGVPAGSPGPAAGGAAGGAFHPAPSGQAAAGPGSAGRRRGTGWLGSLGAGAAVLLLPLLIPGSTYIHYLVALMAIWGIAALGLNLLIGVAGQISLGHAGFMAIGSYTAALLAAKAGASFPVALLGAAAVTGAVGFLMGLPALRLHGHYLALASISFGAAVPEIVLQWDTLTGGHAGVLVPRPTLGPWQLATEQHVYYLAWATAFLLMVLAANLLRSRIGRALMVLRESDVLAQSLGINLVTYKTLAFTVSAVYAGIAGGLYAYLVGFISPFDFTLTSSIGLVAMIVFGGLASVPGSFLGAAALTALLQTFSRMPGWLSIIEGAIIVLFAMFLPGGLVSIPARWRAAFSRRRARRAGGAESPVAAAAMAATAAPPGEGGGRGGPFSR